MSLILSFLLLLSPGADLDAQCHQKDCAWSRLYWHTDMESAQRAARESGKPILALRMLGRLDEELSCANSRYFRTLLYSDRRIAAYLRENYVLEWESVRSVPVITIDMGDGRKMVRTVTGNSIHYVLDADGNPIDAIPGLYAPDVFLRELKVARQLHDSLVPERFAEQVKAHHRRRAHEVVPVARRGLTPAERAARLAMTKSIVEGPMLDRASLGPDDTDFEPMIAMSAAKVKFDANTLDLIRAKHGDVAFGALVKRLSAAVAADTSLNESTLRPRIRGMFVAGEVTTLDALNDRVYREVFETSPDDPWMGLTTPETFTAIDREGLIDSRADEDRP